MSDVPASVTEPIKKALREALDSQLVISGGHAQVENPALQGGLPQGANRPASGRDLA